VASDDIPDITERILNPLVELGFAKTFHIRPNGHDVRITGSAILACIRDSLYAEGSKSIPGWMLNQPEHSIRAFLCGLFTANGTVTNQGLIHFSTVRDDILFPTYELLLRCGIASSYFKENNHDKYHGVETSTIDIINRDRFTSTVGFILERQQSYIKPMSGSMALGEMVAVSEIHNIVDMGIVDDYVYDLEIEDTHTYFANDILVHNTDSLYAHLKNYANLHNLDLDVEQAITIADNLQKRLQADLPSILGNKFLSPPDAIKILEPGREIVGRRGLYKAKKKRYAIYIVDDEGKSVDKLKIMGMETQRSDTPKYIQAFLKKCLNAVVRNDAGYEDVKQIVDSFRSDFRKMDPWRRGSPGGVKNLTKNTKLNEQWLKDSDRIGVKKPLMHFSVRAAINTNLLIKQNNEHRWDYIHDGDKVEVLYLKDNPEGIGAVVIKAGETYVPEWFKILPFDIIKMEKKLLDKKLFNVIGDVLNWDFTPSKSYVDEIAQVVDDFYD